jgi:hypothetical protein
VFNNVWSFVQGVVNKLKSIFNFSWSLPHIKLPHFSISGSFSLNPPSIPHFSVEWYKKAMGGGMILNSPTIFGASGNHLLGGGEAGPQAVVGVSSLMDMIQSAVDSNMLMMDAGKKRVDNKSNRRLPLFPYLVRLLQARDDRARPAGDPFP